MKKAPIFEDLTQLASGAMGMISTLRQQLREEARSRMDSPTARADLISRNEFEQVQGMVKKARLIQEEILQRLDALEGKKPVRSPSARPAAAKKQTAKPKRKSASPRKK